MELSVVYGREIDGHITTFGTTGYTRENTFLVYDRATESVWYPIREGAFTALSGAHAKRDIPYMAQPEVTTLEAWTAAHPDTLILIPSVHRDDS